MYVFTSETETYNKLISNGWKGYKSYNNFGVSVCDISDRQDKQNA